MILKIQSLNNNNKTQNNKPSVFSQNKSSNEIKQINNDNKSKNHLILKDNDYNNISSLNVCDKKKSHECKKYTIKINKNKNIVSFENLKNDSIISKNNPNLDSNKSNIQNQDNSFFDIINQECNNYIDFNESINLNLLDFFCYTKKSKKYKLIKLYDKANSFYRKRMDIAYVFTLLSVLENFIKKK